MKIKRVNPIKFVLTAAIAFGVLATNSYADNFGVQIGAYKNLSDQVLDKANALGDIQTIKSGSVTRVVVGSYSSRKSAQTDLDRAQAAGYSDAFITTLDRTKSLPASYSSSSAHNHASSVSSSHGHTHLPNHINAKLKGLSEEELSRTVILDGKLHFKEGGRFIPIN